MIEQLRSIAGNAVRTARPGEFEGIPPDAVVEPGTADQTAALLALCSQSECNVTLFGGRTSRSKRRTDTGEMNATVAIGTANLAHIADYQPEDLTITVGAGARIRDLQQLLARNGQWLPLDPPSLDAATVGGLVATAASGPLRARYGTPRDHVLGVEIVSGDGRKLSFGGQVVKNVAGYDMVRPIVGSRGTLGLITRVSLRLRPLPGEDRTIVIPTTRDAAADLAGSIAAAWPVAALELVSPTLRTDLDIDSTPNAVHGWRLAVRLHGHADENEEGANRIQSLAGTLPEASAIGSSFWRALQISEASASHWMRFSAQPGHLHATVKIAKRCADLLLGGRTAIAAHAADGIVRVWDTGPHGVPNAAPEQSDHNPGSLTDRSPDVVYLMEHAAAEMTALDGTLTSWMSHRPPLTGRIAQINQQITALFDPAGILPRYSA